MVYRMLLHVVWLSALLGMISDLWAEAPSVARVMATLDQLGDGVWRVREVAQLQLAQWGAGIRGHLEDAVQHQDPEIRARVRQLLLPLKTQELWAGSRVTLYAHDEPATSVFTALAEQSGNYVVLGDQYGKFRDGTVNLDFKGELFWRALDEVCRQSGNQIRPHYDDAARPGLVVSEGLTSSGPIAYGGPVRMQITKAQRSFSEELNYSDLPPKIAHTFQLSVHTMWENRFKLVAHQAHLEVHEATTDTGTKLLATPLPFRAWSVANGGTRQLTMNMRLQPPSRAAKRLQKLRLTWGVLVVGDMSTLEVRELTSSEPHNQDDVRLVVESVEEQPVARYMVTVVITRDLVVPEPSEVAFHENRLELFDAQGRAFRSQGQSNSWTEQGARIRLTFAAEPGTVGPPWMLRLTYPRLRTEHNLEFVFHDVPLPIQMPE